MAYRKSVKVIHQEEITDLINRGKFYTVIDKVTREPCGHFFDRRKALRKANPKKQSVIFTKDLI